VPEVCGEADEEQHREYGQQNMAHIADAAKSSLDALTEQVTQEVTKTVAQTTAANALIAMKREAEARSCRSRWG
jgi:hypothetical protein